MEKIFFKTFGLTTDDVDNRTSAFMGLFVFVHYNSINTKNLHYIIITVITLLSDLSKWPHVFKTL